MVKKKSAERGYMTQKEIDDKIKVLYGKRADVSQKINYLSRILKKENLLTEQNAKNVKSLLAESYVQKAKESGHDTARANAYTEAVRVYKQLGEEKEARHYKVLRNIALRKDASSRSGYGSRIIPKDPDTGEDISTDSRFKKRIKKEGKDITSKLTPVIATFGLLSGIFFLSNNITGNVIGNLTNSTSNVLGAVLLVVGLVAGLFYFKNKRK
jgi:hypothetical protein